VGALAELDPRLLGRAPALAYAQARLDRAAAALVSTLYVKWPPALLAVVSAVRVGWWRPASSPTW